MRLQLFSTGIFSGIVHVVVLYCHIVAQMEVMLHQSRTTGYLCMCVINRYISLSYTDNTKTNNENKVR